MRTIVTMLALVDSVNIGHASTIVRRSTSIEPLLALTAHARNARGGAGSASVSSEFDVLRSSGSTRLRFVLVSIWVDGRSQRWAGIIAVADDRRPGTGRSSIRSCQRRERRLLVWPARK